MWMIADRCCPGDVIAALRQICGSEINKPIFVEGDCSQVPAGAIVELPAQCNNEEERKEAEDRKWLIIGVVVGVGVPILGMIVKVILKCSRRV